MTILTTQTKQKLNNYKAQFLRVCPNIYIKIVNEEEVPYTDAEWLEEVVKRYLINLLKQGNRLLNTDAMTINEFNDIE